MKKSQVIGIEVDVSNLEEMTSYLVDQSMLKTSGRYVCIANVHMVVEAREDSEFNKILSNAFKVTSDGMPLVWALKFRGHKNASRVAGPDLMLRILNKTKSSDHKIFFYGGNDNVINIMKEKIAIDYPGLDVVGCISPGRILDEPAFDINAINTINSSGANILFVGLGCPKQEKWMSVHSGKLDAISIGVGAAFDFYAGVKSRAPLWMQKSGLEWFYRLITEPKRLFIRYFMTNSKFVIYSFIDVFKSNSENNH